MAAPIGNKNARDTKHCDPRIEALDNTRLLDHRGDKSLRLARSVNAIRKCGYRRDFVFELTTFQAAKMLLAECYYCGHIPDIKNPAANPYNGIDRLDSSLGYVPGNIVTACRQCNIAKHVMSEVDFFSLVKRIANKHKL
jgi:5-methylcytosine-specific restriction endonuclease McrA